MLKLILTAFALCILISSALTQRFVLTKLNVKVKIHSTNYLTRDALASSNSGRVLLNQVDKLEYNIKYARDRTFDLKFK